MTDQSKHENTKPETTTKPSLHKRKPGRPFGTKKMTEEQIAADLVRVGPTLERLRAANAMGLKTQAIAKAAGVEPYLIYLINSDIGKNGGGKRQGHPSLTDEELTAINQALDKIRDEL